jgi:hypothetical protein
MISVSKKIAIKRRWWRTRISVASFLLAVVSLGMTLGFLARGAIAATVAAITTASVTTKSLPRLFVGLTYHQVTLVHGIVIPFSPSSLLLLLHLLLLLLLLHETVTATQRLRHTLQNNNHLYIAKHIRANKQCVAGK